VVNLAGVFGAAFGSIYEAATLHRRSAPAYDAGGRITATGTEEYDCRALVDATTERMRTAAGYAETDQRIMILASTLATTPTTDDEISAGGRRWGIASVDQDPARSYWELRGTVRG
jgi:hypothetical protein